MILEAIMRQPWAAAMLLVIGLCLLATLCIWAHMLVVEIRDWLSARPWRKRGPDPAAFSTFRDRKQGWPE